MRYAKAFAANGHSGVSAYVDGLVVVVRCVNYASRVQTRTARTCDSFSGAQFTDMRHGCTTQPSKKSDCAGLTDGVNSRFTVGKKNATHVRAQLRRQRLDLLLRVDQLPPQFANFVRLLLLGGGVNTRRGWYQTYRRAVHWNIHEFINICARFASKNADYDLETCLSKFIAIRNNNLHANYNLSLYIYLRHF